MSEALGLPSVGTAGSLREQVLEVLRGHIISGTLRPGQVYSAPRLAAEFGVSATPVREAMLDLVGEGLVEVVRNKGFRVTSMTDTQLDQIAELRGLIEVPVMVEVARACTGPVAREVERLRPLARRIEAAAAKGDLAAYVNADTAFHLAFLGLHGNENVVEVVGDLRGRSRLYGLAELAASGMLVENAGDHERLVDLALVRDTTGMRALMTTHIGHIRALWAG